VATPIVYLHSYNSESNQSMHLLSHKAIEKVIHKKVLQFFCSQMALLHSSVASASLAFTASAFDTSETRRCRNPRSLSNPSETQPSALPPQMLVLQTSVTIKARLPRRIPG
jgi:hypothetical protein